MNCERVRSLLPAYVDGELDLVTTLEIEEHLATCPECSRAYAELRELQSVLASQRAALIEPTPPALAQRVRAVLRQAQISDNTETATPPAWTRAMDTPRVPIATTAIGGKPRRPHPRPHVGAMRRIALMPSINQPRSAPFSPAINEPRPAPSPSWAESLRLLAPTLAAAAFLLLLVILALGFSNGWPWTPRTDLLAQEVETAHVRSLMTDHLTDVTSTDQHTVKPWFDGKLDFSPPVVDLAAQGFPLTGGRLEYIDNHQAAALVYMRNKHVINLLIWPTTDPPAGPRQTTINGYHLVSWNQSGMTFWAVSDVETSELLDFVALIQKNAG